MIIASKTGRSALKALEVLRGTGTRRVVVTHFPGETRGPRRDIPIGLGRPEYAHVKRYLEERGVAIVQGTRPFGGIGRALGWDAPVPATFVDKALELFGPGTKIAIEAAVMATDAGAVKAGEMVVSLGGTFKGLDTASVVYNIFTDFEVLELIARPLHPGKRQAQTRAERIAGRPRSVLPFYRDPTGKGSICSGDPRGSRRLRQRPTASTGEASSREKNEQGIQRLL